MTNFPAYLLVSHGSRDPRPNMAMLNLANIISQKLRPESVSEHQKQNSELTNLLTKTKPILIETACLELTPISLHQKILKLADLAVNSGIKKINIVPLFLSPGVHVQEDIPLEIALAKQQLPGKIELCLLPYLGENLQIQHLLEQEFNRLNAEAKIIFAHGSRRQGGNQPMETIAHNLSALTAYWSVSPNLETQISQLVNLGISKIAIVPYFLFGGKIIETTAQQILILQRKYPQVELMFGETLDKNPNLIQLIMELLL